MSFLVSSWENLPIYYIMAPKTISQQIKNNQQHLSSSEWVTPCLEKSTYRRKLNKILLILIINRWPLRVIQPYVIGRYFEFDGGSFRSLQFHYTFTSNSIQLANYSLSLLYDKKLMIFCDSLFPRRGFEL